LITHNKNSKHHKDNITGLLGHKVNVLLSNITYMIFAVLNLCINLLLAKLS